MSTPSTHATRSPYATAPQTPTTTRFTGAARRAATRRQGALGTATARPDGSASSEIAAASRSACPRRPLEAVWREPLRASARGLLPSVEICLQPGWWIPRLLLSSESDRVAHVSCLLLVSFDLFPFLCLSPSLARLPTIMFGCN
jgi:hypothetical protein